MAACSTRSTCRSAAFTDPTTGRMRAITAPSSQRSSPPGSLRLALLFCCWLALAAAAFGGVEEDWQRIVALDAGPALKFNSREEARQLAVRHLDRQEEALRAFLAAYPGDVHTVDGALRVPPLLEVPRDLASPPARYGESVRIPGGLE